MSLVYEPAAKLDRRPAEARRYTYVLLYRLRRAADRAGEPQIAALRGRRASRGERTCTCTPARPGVVAARRGEPGTDQPRCPGASRSRRAARKTCPPSCVLAPRDVSGDVWPRRDATPARSAPPPGAQRARVSATPARSEPPPGAQRARASDWASYRSRGMSERRVGLLHAIPSTNQHYQLLKPQQVLRT